MKFVLRLGQERLAVARAVQRRVERGDPPFDGDAVPEEQQRIDQRSPPALIRAPCGRPVRYDFAVLPGNDVEVLASVMTDPGRVEGDENVQPLVRTGRCR